VSTKTAPSTSSRAAASGPVAGVGGARPGLGAGEPPFQVKKVPRPRSNPQPTPLTEPDAAIEANIEPSTINVAKRKAGLEVLRQTYEEVVPPRVLVTLSAVIVGLAMLFGVLGYGIASLGTSQYGARADVLYRLTDSQPTGFLREDRNLTTQVLIAGSRAVLSPVARRQRLSVDQLRKKVSVSVLPESSILRFEVTDPSRAKALKLVTDVSRQYVRNSANATLKPEVALLSEQIANLDQQISNFRNLENPTDLIVSEFQGLIAERTAIQTRLRQRRVDALGGKPAEFVSEPYSLTEQVSPHPKIAALGGGLLGVLLGGLFAIGVLGWQRRIRHHGT
jgi:capsular polysaccharide biosynthesis protein